MWLIVAMIAPDVHNSIRIAQKAAWALNVPITVKHALSGFATWRAKQPIVPNAASIPAKSWKNSLRKWQMMDMVIGQWLQEKYWTKFAINNFFKH